MTPYSDDPILFIAWARDRALAYLPDRRQAVTSLVSDLSKHDATARFGEIVGPSGLEILIATSGAERDKAVRVWIEATCAVLAVGVLKSSKAAAEEALAELAAVAAAANAKRDDSTG